MTLPRINSHNSWSQLEEVWLGDVYPVSWYEHLDPEVRDIFQQITEITQQDLAQIQRTLEGLGVTVQRPRYSSIDHYVDAAGMLRKPDICPRDVFVVIDNRLFVPQWWPPCWDHVLDQYRQDPASTVVPNFSPKLQFNGANVVRTGRDLLLDMYYHKTKGWNYSNELPEYRVHLVDNGGHLDACFATLRPGLILANNYFEDYDHYYPGWELIRLNEPSYWSKSTPDRPPSNGKFYDTTVGTNQAFNDHVIQHAQDWVGQYTETYFELNCLVINESTVVMLGENEAVFKDLERRGITVHWVPMRTRPFWDSGVHCMTVDIRRQSTLEDYFPDRG